MLRALLFGVHTRASDFWNFRYLGLSKTTSVLLFEVSLRHSILRLVATWKLWGIRHVKQMGIVCKQLYELQSKLLILGLCVGWTRDSV